MGKHRREDDLDDQTLGLESEARYFRHRAETATNEAERIYWNGRAKTAWRYIYIFTGRAAFGVIAAAVTAFELSRRAGKIVRAVALTTATSAAVGVTTISAENIVHPHHQHHPNQPAIAETAYKTPARQPQPTPAAHVEPGPGSVPVATTSTAASAAPTATRHARHVKPAAQQEPDPSGSPSATTTDDDQDDTPPTQDAMATDDPVMPAATPSAAVDVPSRINIPDPTKPLDPVSSSAAPDLDPVLHPSLHAPDPTQLPSAPQSGSQQRQPLLPQALNDLHLGGPVSPR